VIATRSQLIATIGHEWQNQELLDHALTHRSYAVEHNTQDNERLEFLGDAVLELVITENIVESFSEATEGQLSRIRSKLVRTETLAQAANDWLLGDSIMMGKGEAASGGAKRSRALAGTFEAVLGALFLDGGFHVVREIVRGVFLEQITSIEDPAHFGMDPKSALQEMSMQVMQSLPEYSEVSAEGPAHEREFVWEVRVGDLAVCIGKGSSKQRAQRAAAAQALDIITKKSTQDA
jgi:ribonuclease III